MSTMTKENQEEFNAVVVDLVDATIEALDQAKDTKEEFSRMLEQASDHFENGDDADGYAVLQDVLDTLQDFVVFCRNIQDLADCLIPQEIVVRLNDHCKQLEDYLVTLLQEMEKKNYIEIADVLRYDLSDNLREFYPTFEEIAREFRECRKHAD